MYSSGYSQVSKSSPQAQKKMQYRSKGKSCGYYMRIVFFFSSLIQSLIIVSLVLFLVYGKSQDSASTARIQDLEESFSRLSIENVALRHQRKNLTNLLNITLIEKARNDWDLANCRYISNISAMLIQDLDRKMQQCYSELFLCKSSGRFAAQCPTTTLQIPGNCNCGLLVERLQARLALVESNFTQTAQRMRMEMDQTAKERDNLNLEVIRLRRDKATHEKELEFFRQRCKADFAQSLKGISNVSRAFLEKIDSFSSQNTFHITCPKQRDYLEQIRTNCTSLSLDVEDKFQRYLNNVGDQVSSIQSENSRLKAENWRLSDDYRWCSTNRTGLILLNRQNLDKLQRKNDEEKERLLMDKMRLNGDIEVLQNSVKYKSREVDHLSELLKQLNMSCISKMGFGFPGGAASRPGAQPQSGWGLLGGGGSSSSAGGSQFSKPGSGGLGSSFGSFGSTFNKPGSTGTGSSSTSLFSAGSSSSIGSAYNKPGSTGTGSSSSSLFSSGPISSVGSAYNKPGSTGTGSSSTSLFSLGSSSSAGSAYNKPGSTGTGSSSSSLFSSGSSSSTGSAFNKPGSTGTGSSSSSLFSLGSGSSTGSAYNKPGSTGTGSSSSSGSSSSILSAFNKPGSTGSASSGTGSNKPALSGKSSSPFGTSSGSAGSTSSSGTGSNKPTSNVKSSSGSSSSSTGSTSKSGSSSSGFSWLGFGSSSSKTGSGTGKGPSPGNSYGGAGSPYGAGRTSGVGGGPISVAQHLKDLQRIISPPGPEEKQDLSRMLG